MKTKIIFFVIASALTIAETDLKAQATTVGNVLSGPIPNPTQYLGSSNNYDAVFKTNNTERMRILSSNGNVGIGFATINPTFAKVEISAANAFSATPDALVGLSINKQVSSTLTRRIFFVPHLYGWGYNRLSENGDCGMFWNDGNTGTNTSGLVIAAFSGGGGAYEGMRITHQGNVGIGTPLTSNPNNYKLAVNGTIGAKAVKIEVTSGWPDYVFEKEYKLRSIKELESFLMTNKHLPNVPSAAEVEKEGIDVGNMNAKLLEKIEELTLYMISQQKQIKTLEEHVSVLKKN